jgi:hypothetical protein
MSSKGCLSYGPLYEAELSKARRPSMGRLAHEIESGVASGRGLYRR